jgi:hypothetical protein
MGKYQEETIQKFERPPREDSTWRLAFSSLPSIRSHLEMEVRRVSSSYSAMLSITNLVASCSAVNIYLQIDYGVVFTSLLPWKTFSYA